MTQVTLDNINPLVLEKLQTLATQNNRSLSDEIKAILERVTADEISKNYPTTGNYPLRGKSMIIASDFDEPMLELWDALAE